MPITRRRAKATLAKAFPRTRPSASDSLTEYEEARKAFSRAIMRPAADGFEMVWLWRATIAAPTTISPGPSARPAETQKPAPAVNVAQGADRPE